jgi:nucleotide-binding universal stress UspA family protein
VLVILVATDFSPRSDRAIRRAILIARERSARLVLLHALDGEVPDRLLSVQRDSADSLLAEMAATISNSDGVPCSYHRLTGDPLRVMVDVAAKLDPGFIVLGPHRRKILNDVFVGTTAERVIRKSRKPILMANGTPAGSYQNVLVATDMTDCSSGAVQAARELGFLDGVRVSLLHVLNTPEKGMMQRSLMPADEIEGYALDTRAEATASLKRFAAGASLPAGRMIVQPVEMSIAETVHGAVRKRGADLLIIATHGRSGLEKFFLGSVAEEILRYAQVDVLVVPSPF